VSHESVRTRLLGEVRAVDFQRYALAVGDLNPVYFDAAAARAAGYPGIVAPPNFITSIRVWDAGVAEDALRADGSEPDNYPAELIGRRLMGGGQDLQFTQPVRPGDVVTESRRITEVRERQTKTGTLLFVVQEIVFSNQREEVLAILRETLIGA
jgi:acyl dehydratase